MFRLVKMSLCCLFIWALLVPSVSSASFSFEDTRFQGVFTTENLDAIIREYELFDSWYWSTEADVIQTFHGQEDHPAWTDSTVNRFHRTSYSKGWYGCRWGIEKVLSFSPSGGGYGECFGFAQFIGYLLSGDRNPQKNWNKYYSTEASGGLRVGDIIRVEYKKNKHDVHHSAIVYAIDDGEYLFLQISGSQYNQISVGRGFTDGNMMDERLLENISRIPGMKICRSPLSLQETGSETAEEH